MGIRLRPKAEVLAMRRALKETTMQIENRNLPLHDWAKKVAEVSASKGFVLATWETLPMKLMLMVTEVQEAIDAAPGRREDFAMELADIAIRMLESLDSIWRGQWSAGRVTRRQRIDDTSGLVWRSPPETFAPVLRMLVLACEAWRKDNRPDAMNALEIALVYVFRVADATNINLMEAIAEKTARNELRPHLHGKAKANA